MRNAAVILTIVVIATMATSADAASAFKPVYKVDSAAATIHGHKLTIIASGAVSTGGWSKARLRLKPGHRAEARELDFEFLAVAPPPGETVIQAVVPVTATVTTHLPPYGVTEVRVNSLTNSAVTEITRVR